MLLFIPVDDTPNLLGVLPSSLLAVHIPDGVGQDPGTRRESPRPFHRFEVIVLLAPDDEVGPNGINSEQSLEVVIPPVEDVERVFFIRDDVHRVNIVDSCFRDMEELWNGSLKVVQGMYLDTPFSLVLSEDGPFESLQAKFDSR